MAFINKAVAVCAIFACVAVSSKAQILRGYLNDAQQKVNSFKKGGGGGSLSQSEIADGLKEALKLGAKNATSKISAVDGFFGNALIKILMPPDAQRVEKTLREMGLGKQVDDAILSMNRAAEDASSRALEIFINAITHMSIQDGLAILKGGDNAATAYLKEKTTAQLTAAYKPVIQEALDRVGATKYWTIVFNTYNSLPTTFKKVNPDLPSYVTERALNGVFVYIADEETKIRQNPAARVSDILKKVFAQQ